MTMIRWEVDRATAVEHRPPATHPETTAGPIEAMIAIRQACDGDGAGIAEVHRAAFGRPAEADLVEALTADGHAALSLVADLRGIVVGHVLLSRLLSPDRALALGPLAVLPSHQRLGIGSTLVETAIDLARNRGDAAILVLGDPAYYTRFGFSLAAARPFPSPYSGEHFMALLLTDPPLAPAPAVYAPPFAALG